MILSLMIGLLTPPVGTVLYVLSSTMKVPVGEVFQGSLPFIVPLLVICLAIIFFPDFVTWLPEQARPLTRTDRVRGTVLHPTSGAHRATSREEPP